MAKTDYVSLEIDGVKADFDPDGQVPLVNYALEDEDDFEEKKSAESFDIELPATLINDQIHNTMSDPSTLDNTPGGVHTTFRPARYIASGNEILIGKYLQQRVRSKNGQPRLHKGKIYGLNGDWLIELKEKTISDFLNPNVHTYTEATIRSSWAFDGTNENLDYVYAPVRYRKKFGGVIVDPATDYADNDVRVSDMRPSLSPYWILYRGFKSIGYRIVSTFMDLPYYRRGVLLWTWGAFDFIDSSRWEGLKFLAIQNTPPDPLPPSGWNADWWNNANVDYNDYPNLMVTDDPGQRPGAYDNSGLFAYTGPSATIKNMFKWDYPTSGPLVMGNVTAGFSISINWRYFLNSGSEGKIQVEWLKNGVVMQTDVLFDLEAPFGGTRERQDFTESFFEVDIQPNDYVGCRVLVVVDKDLGAGQVGLFVEQMQLDYIKLSVGSTVDLKGNYPKFKNYKWLDLLRGEIDLYDWSIQTDPIRKEVYIEPTHAYTIDGVTYPGYYNRKQLDWSQKKDYAQEEELELFSDYEREMLFKFQDDTADGGLKKIQDRNQAVIGMGKYVLPDRFKTEKKEKINRFYAPVMHREHPQFKLVTGIAPQLVCIVPENISNTSNPESENTYQPKRAYYKGVTAGVGGWIFNGMYETSLPFVFAVNYKPGGENDPILSYSDQLISGQVGTGLMKKFFMQRLAIIRNGKRYDPVYIMLNNNDVANFLHRESIIIDNMEYILTSISNYNPISSESTQCRMWLFAPKSEVDLANSYPSLASIVSGGSAGSFDIKYWQHILLSSDI